MKARFKEGPQPCPFASVSQMKMKRKERRHTEATTAFAIPKPRWAFQRRVRSRVVLQSEARSASIENCIHLLFNSIFQVFLSAWIALRLEAIAIKFPKKFRKPIISAFLLFLVFRDIQRSMTHTLDLTADSCCDSSRITWWKPNCTHEGNLSMAGS